MAQTSITNFFSKRKRTADSTKNKAKVVVLDISNSANISSPVPLFKESVCNKTSGISSDRVQSERLQKITPSAVNRPVIPSASLTLGADSNAADRSKTPKPIDKQSLRSRGSKAVSNCDIRQALTQKLSCPLPEVPLSSARIVQESRVIDKMNELQHNIQEEIANISREELQRVNANLSRRTRRTFSTSSLKQVAEETANTAAFNAPSDKNPVLFELRGPLSPEKRKKKIQLSQNEPVAESSRVTQDALSPEEENANEKVLRGLTTPVKKNVMTINKDLPLTDIKAKISRSAKLAELQKSLKKLSKGADKLKEIEQRKEQLDRPQIQKFEAIELEVPISPQKNVYSSPQKIIYNSPQKIYSTPQKEYSSLRSTPSKSPATKRFASLAQPITTALTLPYSYRCIAEIFRAVDAVASMMYNRQEIITFKKLKPAVQEMLRRNFSEKHLGQIKRVLPSAYDFKQEKVKNFGLCGKADNYDLTLTPLPVEAEKDKSTAKESTSNYASMTPSVLLERRQAFHKSLLEKTKDYHEEFLRNQDPPLDIPRENLTRWHPDFEVNLVPEIEPEQLPQAPNADKFSSAKDVLERARSMFSYNSRLCNAMETLSADKSLKIKTQSNGTPQLENASSSPSSSSSSSSASSALKGIPKALLEKVRARQAAKAMEAMTRTSAADREAICFMRLPEIARILRNVYVTEKKNVLCLELALEKLGNSYREKLSAAELQEHVRLLMKTVPGWLTVHTVRKTDFLKLSKHGDVNLVIKQLEQVAAEKNR